MFSNKKRSLNPSTTDTLIGQESIIEGKVTSKASLRIEGEIHGDIECAGDVTFGEEAVAHSNITARNIFNAGTVHGSISSKGALTITNKGKVYGNISVASLSIAEGGIFQGTSKMEKTSTSEDSPESSPDISDITPRLHKMEKTTASAK